MNWGEISGLCEVELQKLRSDASIQSVWLSVNGSHALLELERETDESVSFAVRTFAESRAWPLLSQMERAMLMLRLDFAAGVADLLYQQPAPWSDSNDAQNDEMRIGWLMLFAWEQFGFQYVLEWFGRFSSGGAASP